MVSAAVATASGCDQGSRGISLAVQRGHETPARRDRGIDRGAPGAGGGRREAAGHRGSRTDPGGRIHVGQGGTAAIQPDQEGIIRGAGLRMKSVRPGGTVFRGLNFVGSIVLAALWVVSVSARPPLR